MFLLEALLLAFAMLSPLEQPFRSPLVAVLGTSMILVLAAILKLRFERKK